MSSNYLTADNGVSSGVTGITQSAGNDGTLQIRTTTSGGTATTAVTIDNSQNVGIGTTSPNIFSRPSGLSVGISSANNAFLQINSATGSQAEVAIGVNAVRQASIFSDASTFSLIAATSIPMVFGTANTERARIDSSGNLLVGTTSTVASALTTLSTSTARYALAAACTTANLGNGVALFQKFDNNSTTSNVLVQFAMNNGGNGQGQINANGSGAAAFGSYSDSRLKENIVDLPSQLSNIMALRPVEFDYIESEGGGHQIGFIAQEMQTIYPDAVGERAPDNMLSITGWSKTEARLVKAIQELSAQVTSLQATVETQATTIATLQNKIGA